MGKILSWLLLAALVYLVYKFLVISRRKAEREAARHDAAGPAAPGTVGERMLPCARCGVHVPASEAVLARGRAYCCAAHRDADAPG